jgi:thymidylate kinase
MKPLIVAIEGVDGAGKSTIASYIAKKYNAIIPPHFINLGLLPDDIEERLLWYRETKYSFATTAAYLRSQQRKLEMLEEYNKNLHYKQIFISDPPVVLWDRGPLSALAYGFASLKLNTQLSDSIICQAINHQFTYQIPNNHVIRVLLYPEIEETNKLLARILKRGDYGINKEREGFLIEQQIYYYKNFYLPSGSELKLDPFSPLEDNIKKIELSIDKILSEKFSKPNEGNKITLYEVVEQITNSKRKGKIAVLGDIIIKCATDSFFEIYLENSVDEEILLWSGRYKIVSHINLNKPFIIIEN